MRSGIRINLIQKGYPQGCLSVEEYGSKHTFMSSIIDRKDDVTVGRGHSKGQVGSLGNQNLVPMSLSCLVMVAECQKGRTRRAFTLIRPLDDV